jgi:hypothetical protein
MKRFRHFALVIGILLPTLVTPLLWFTNEDSCDTGPLEFIRGFNAYWDVHGSTSSANNSASLDLLIIGAISVLFIAYYFGWFKKRKHSTIIYWIGLLLFEAIIFGIVKSVLSWKCFTF